MKKKISYVMLILLCMSLFSGCGSYAKVDDSTVFVLKKGDIVSTDVEAFSKDYSESELKDYVDGAIDEFNSKHTDMKVKKDKLKIKDDVAKLTLKYDSFEAYTKFNGVDLFVGTIRDAFDAGYAFDVKFVSVEDGKPVEEADVFALDNSSKIVIYRGSNDLQVDGKIKYVSVESVNLVSENKIKVVENYNILDAISEKNTEAVLDTEDTEISTEIIEDIPGSTESTEVTFDFPEEEEVTKSEFTSVYTYVIYE